MRNCRIVNTCLPQPPSYYHFTILSCGILAGIEPKCEKAMVADVLPVLFIFAQCATYSGRNFNQNACARPKCKEKPIRIICRISPNTRDDGARHWVIAFRNRLIATLSTATSKCVHNTLLVFKCGSGVKIVVFKINRIPLSINVIYCLLLKSRAIKLLLCIR